MMAKMEWNGFEWIGMESNGMDWNGMEWNGMTWHGTKASSFRFWGKSRTKASFSHLQHSDFEGSLARKLCFHIFHFHFWKEVSHESCVFTSSTLKFQGSLALKLRFHIFHFHFLRDFSHESFGFTSSTFRFWRKSRTKASFSHLQLSDFEEILARKLRFHIFNSRILKEVSHESFGFHLQILKEASHKTHESCGFTSSTFRFWGNSRTKAALSHLELLEFEGSLAWELRFHIFHLQISREVSHESFAFSHLQLSNFEGRLARKLRFHIFNCRILKEVSHESFVFTSSTLGFWRKSRTKASVSHLPLQILKEVSHKTHESFGFTSSTFRFWGNSRTKAAFSHLELLEFEGSLAWELRFYIFRLQISKEVSHESFAFSHLQLSDFEGSLARNACLRDSACTKCCVLQDKTCLGRCVGKLVRRMVSKHVRLGSNHGRIGPAVELKVQASSSLYLKIENLKEVSHESEVFHESFVFTSSTFRFWRKSRTKASLSHIFNCRILREVLHEMHVWEIARLHEVLCFAGQNVSSLSGGWFRNTFS